MARPPNRASELSRLRRFLCCFLIVAASIAVVGAIESSRDFARTESDSAEDDARRMDILAVAGPTPTPFPCPLCWFARTQTDNFDYADAAPIARRLARNKRTRSTAAVGHL